MTKRKEAEQQETPVAEPRNDSPNPPTTEVPEEGAPPYPPEDAVLVEASPVWVGGDPGTAVPSPANEDDTYYHPEGEVPALDTDGDGTPDETDLDDDNDTIPDDVDDDDDGDGTLDVDEVPPATR